MDLITVLEKCNFQVTFGTAYLWKCWPNSHIIDLCPMEGVSVSVIFNRDTKKVHQVITDLLDSGNGYRWIDPISHISLLAETIERSTNSNYIYSEERGNYVSEEEILDFIVLKLKTG